jgi:hypothetical protein
MSETQDQRSASPIETVPDDESSKTQVNASDGQSSEQQAADPARIIEEHHVVGPHGEDEIETIDDRGRRWYHLRPDPRGRADLLGVNYTWWTLVWIILIVFLIFPWW